MKKKLLTMLLAFAVCFCGFTGTAWAAGLSNFQPVKSYTAGQFTDVSSSAWYATNVKEAYEYDLINGKDSTHFDPNGNLTLAEAVKLAVCLHSVYYNGSVNIDTAAAVWYQPYLDYAKQNGILAKGFDNYNRAATRLEFANIFAKALPQEALEKINTVEDNAIPDLPLAGNGADGVYLLYRAGVLTGNDSSGVFSPNSNIARSEAAAITTRMANPNLRRSITLLKGESSNLTAEQISAQCSPAVFYLEVYDKNGNAFASGSGFFISSNGIAVTNYHVIEGAHSAKIKTADGKVYNVSGVYDYDEGRDLALLKINGQGFSYLTADKGTVTNGMTVYTIGSPKGLDNTISQGLVSNANRVISGYSYIQISAPISHGSSGGALLNGAGKVIGVTSAGLDEAQNLNFAIPISAVDNLNRSTVTPLSVIANGDTTSVPLKVSPASLTVNVSSTGTVQVTSENPNAESVFYNIMGNGQSYVSCSWGDWNSSSTVIPLYIKGLSAGTAQIEVYETDASGNKVGNSITVNVTVKGSGSSSVAYYSGFYPAVDFGKYFGIPLADVVDSGEMTGYLYDIIDLGNLGIDQTLDTYISVLGKNGFVFDHSFDDSEGYPVLVYRNSQYGVYIFLGMIVNYSDAYMLICLTKNI